jgi:cytochrome P450
VTRTFLQQILLLDNPEHMRLRKLVSYVFVPKYVAAMRRNARIHWPRRWADA